MVSIAEIISRELRPGIWQVIAIMSNGIRLVGFGVSYNDALIDMMRSEREYGFDFSNME